MNIYPSMLGKKNQKILSDICTYIDSYIKAKHGRKPEQAVVTVTAFKSIMSDVTKYCEKNRKPAPEILTINGVKICSR